MKVPARTLLHKASPRTAPRPFLSGDELRDLLERRATERPLLVDARGERQYRKGHIPGSLNVPARELNTVEDGVRRLATNEEIGRRLGSPGTRDVVVYGRRGGADAAHLWWTLRAAGIEHVRLLDGGIEAWQAEGGSLAVDDEQPSVEAKPETQAAGEATQSLVSREELLRRLGDPDLAIVDTREPEEFSGELMAAKRGGHVPGALLFPWTTALDAGLRLRPEDELRKLLAPVFAKPEAIVYCQSGVRAAHTLAVLEMLGHPRARLYLGSWGEWGNREDTPVEVEAGS